MIDNQHAGRCQVHGSELEGAVVSIQYDKRPAKGRGGEYFAARKALFPNCDDPLHAKPANASARRPLLIHRGVCFQCNFARDEWLVDSYVKPAGASF